MTLFHQNDFGSGIDEKGTHFLLIGLQNYVVHSLDLQNSLDKKSTYKVDFTDVTLIKCQIIYKLVT